MRPRRRSRLQSAPISGGSCGGALEPLEPRWLLAGQQIITATADPGGVDPGAQTAIEVRYEASDGDETLSGLGLRMHFDSSLLTFDGFTDLLQDGLNAQQVQSDGDDRDGDARTDQRALLFWLDQSVSWPGADATPTLLFRANFTASASFVATDIHFTASTTHPGYTLSAPSITLAAATPNVPPQVVAPIADLDLLEDDPAVSGHADLLAVFEDADQGDGQLIFSISRNTGSDVVTATVAGTRLDLRPRSNRNGRADITIRATDPHGAFAEDTFTVTIDPDNDRPTATGPILDQLLNAGAQRTIALANHFGDVDIATNADRLEYAVTSNTGTSDITTSITGVELTLDVVGGPGAVAQLTVRATDLQQQFAEQQFQVRVNRAPETAPVAVAIIVDEDALDDTLDLAQMFTDADAAHGDDLVWEIVSNDNEALLDAAIDATTLTLDYLPDRNGSADLIVRATDTTGATAEQTISVTVFPVNDEPVAGDSIGDQVLAVGATARIPLDAHFSDVDRQTNDDVLTYSVADHTRPEVITTRLDGPVLTLEAPGQSGTAVITMRATDQAGEFAEQTFNVATSAPEGVPQVVGTIADVTVSEDLPPIEQHVDLAQVFDDPVYPDDQLTWSIAANSVPGIVEPTFDGDALDLAFSPHEHGSTDITVRATNPAGGFSETTFRVTVLPVNDRPRVADALPPVDVTSSGAGDTFDVNLTGFFADDDGDPLTLSVSDLSDPLLASGFITDGTLHLTVAPGAEGTATITIRATDPSGTWIEQDLEITIAPPGRPDLVVTAFTPPSIPVVPGAPATFTVTIANQGAAAIDGYTLDLLVTNTRSPQVHARFDVTPMVPLPGAPAVAAPIDQPLGSTVERTVVLDPGADETFTIETPIPALAGFVGAFTVYGMLTSQVADEDASNNDFSTSIWSDEFIALGPDRKSARRTLNTASGATVRVSLSNATGHLVVNRFRGATPVPDLRSIVLATSTTKSSLSIANKGDASIGDVTAQFLKRLSARKMTLDGHVRVDVLDDLKVADILDGATVTTLQAAQRGLRISAGRIGDVDFNLVGEVKRFRAIEYAAGRIVADVLTTFQTTGHRKLGSSGDVGADIVLSGLGAKKATLARARIKGALDGVTWHVAGPGIKLLDVRATVSNSEIRTTGDIVSAKFGHMTDSSLLAGVHEAITGVGALSAASFVETAEIKRIRVKGLLRNAFIAASLLSNVTLGDILPQNGGVDFGLAADSIGRVRRNGGGELVFPLGGAGEVERDGDYVFRLV
ncbi:MAG: hypothetical protein CMJ18_06535 [Phycisphaeraceae bacterium]|nr:hypothetical protein [Phycisphaeraceae bacterium]